MPSNADTVYVQRLMRDVVPDAFEKFFNENSIKTWSALVQDDILHAAFVLMDLITAQLKVWSTSPMQPKKRKMPFLSRFLPCLTALVVHQPEF